MSRQVVSRSQRRLEKKQTLVLVVLVLVVALGSYGLGVMVGRSGGDTVVEEDLTSVDRIAIPVADEGAAEGAEQTAAETVDPELTFYDTLPEGAQPPMGSGINLPAQPEIEAPAAAKAAANVPAPQAPAPTAKVSQPAMPKAAPAPKPASVSTKAVAQGGYVIQVASVQKKAGAQDLSTRLAKKGYPAFVEEADLGAKGVWFRVYVGPYATRQAADGTALSLKTARLATSPLVRKR